VNPRRIAVAVGIALLTAFVVLVLVAGTSGAGAVVVAILTIGGLVAAGNLLYGRHSHGAAAQARIRPAQEAANRAADLAAETRRATADAARRGERFCPLDPARMGPTGPASLDPGRADRARLDSGRAHPARSDSGRADPARSDPGPAQDTRAGPAHSGA
jgi:hypothetical protein